MLTVKGIYDHGKIKLNQDINFKKTINVLITFLDDPDIQDKAQSGKNNFSFKKSKELLKNYKGSLSQAILEERRSDI